jgi:adenylate kinase
MEDNYDFSETEEAISNRLNVYNDQTAPLVGFYKEEGLLLSVKATSSQSQCVPISF